MAPPSKGKKATSKEVEVENGKPSEDSQHQPVFPEAATEAELQIEDSLLVNQNRQSTSQQNLHPVTPEASRARDSIYFVFDNVKFTYVKFPSKERAEDFVKANVNFGAPNAANLRVVPFASEHEFVEFVDNVKALNCEPPV
jgi:hypothetical protein